MAESAAGCEETFALDGERLRCSRPDGHAGQHEAKHSRGGFKWRGVGPSTPRTQAARVYLARPENDVPALPAPTSVACLGRLEHDGSRYTCTRPANHPGLHVAHDADHLGRHTVRAIWECAVRTFASNGSMASER